MPDSNNLIAGPFVSLIVNNISLAVFSMGAFFVLEVGMRAYPHVPNLRD